jgi:hypothetical protein
MSGNNSQSKFGMTDSGIVWGLATIVLIALGILVVLRHTFGSIKVSAGAES